MLRSRTPPPAERAGGADEAEEAEEAEEVRREQGGGGKAGPGPQEDRQRAGGLRFPAGQGVEPTARCTGAALAALATAWLPMSCVYGLVASANSKRYVQISFENKYVQIFSKPRPKFHLSSAGAHIRQTEIYITNAISGGYKLEAIVACLPELILKLKARHAGTAKLDYNDITT